MHNNNIITQNTSASTKKKKGNKRNSIKKMCPTVKMSFRKAVAQRIIHSKLTGPDLRSLSIRF